LDPAFTVRRRCQRDDVVVDAGRGLRLVSFEVDALTGTTLDGVERGAFVPTKDRDAPTVVARDHRAAVVDVADSILEDNEQLRAVINAQAGARAPVRVDQYPHRHRPSWWVHLRRSVLRHEHSFDLTERPSRFESSFAP
jgi:hypothetical protein